MGKDKIDTVNIQVIQGSLNHFDYLDDRLTKKHIGFIRKYWKSVVKTK